MSINAAADCRTAEWHIKQAIDDGLMPTLAQMIEEDGYELSHDNGSRSGLINEIFWGGSYSNEYRLRKGSSNSGH